MLAPRNKKPAPPFQWNDYASQLRYVVATQQQENTSLPRWYWEPTKPFLDALSRSDVPCTICLGAGYYYDLNDSPDPVEGNKVRCTFKCRECNSTGFVNSQQDVCQFRKYLNAAWGNYQRSLAKHDMIVSLCEKLQRHLTGEEISLLREIEEI